MAALCQQLGLDPDEFFAVKAAAEGFRPAFPSPCSARQALSQFFDIQGKLRAATAALLLPFVQDAAQKAWLEELLSKKNRDQFHRYIDDPRRSICSLLTNELSSCRLTLEQLLNILPYMQPRYYTISSSSSR